MNRSSGILLPVSALPGPCGIGDLGTDARDFIDFLAAAGQRYWQILPLNPPDGAHSPYLSASTFAGSTDLLSPEPFLARGALTADEVRAVDWGEDPMRVDYDRVHAGRAALWDAAFAREQAAVTPALRAALAAEPWLRDYCLYMAVKEAQGGAPWYAWPQSLRDRDAAALAEAEDCEGAAMICLPEIPFDPDHFIDRVDAIQQQTPSLVVAVSEGVRIADGRYVCELAHTPVNVDAFGHTYLSGTAHYLSSLVAAKLHSKTRAVELSTLQRCAAHVASETDVSEAFDVGAFAVDAAFSGKTGMMAALKRVSDAPYTCGFELHDIHDIANLEKKIPLDWIDAEHYRLREPFFAYARPLIAEEVKPEYQKGLPRHLKLKR